MVNWNSGYTYNGTSGVFRWNAVEMFIVINVREALIFNETLGDKLVSLILQEKAARVYDELITTTLVGPSTPDRFLMQDIKALGMRMLELAESLQVKDELVGLIVKAFINDKTEILDQAKTLATIIAEQDLTIEDIPNLQVFLTRLDTIGLRDLKGAIEAAIINDDAFAVTDREPRTSISDFLIGAIDDYDTAYDWLIPFDLKIDWDNTKLQVMPEAELTKIQMPGVDGSIVEDSVYKDRLFEIVAFSEIGLTTSQKEELKTKIARVLDATKHDDMKLTVQASGGAFDVRYEGKAEITDMPSYVKVKIPLRTPPYGYDAFENELEGGGLVSNLDGDAPLRVVHTVTGKITNPTFTLGTITYIWDGTIPAGQKLVINHELMTCYLIDENGVKHNALAKLTGEFQAIPAGKAVTLTVANNTAAHLLTEWRTKILW